MDTSPGRLVTVVYGIVRPEILSALVDLDLRGQPVHDQGA